MSLSRLLCAIALCAIAVPAFGQAANDECVNAIAIGEGTVAFDNTGDVVNGPTDCDVNMSNDVWYLYTATNTGTVTIGTCGAAGTMTDTVLTVYDGALGCPLAGDVGLACDDDTCNAAGSPDAFNSEVTLPVIAGETYYVQVGGWNGGSGTSELSIVAIEGNCFDGLDDDGDALVDCADPDCAVACDESQNCADGIDNDGNGDVDCLDAACAAAAACDESQNCGDGLDNDLDTLTDCDDPDCLNIGPCNESLNCGDGIDNDGDGDIDCLDADCLGIGPCDESANCGDGIDNDLDTLVDCDDPDCLDIGPCAEAGNCGDLIDNDGDGDVDCLDVDCALDILCVPVAANDECTGATGVGEGTFAFNNINTPVTGPTDADVNMTGDVWFLYTATVTGLVNVNTCGSAGTLLDTVIIVYDGALCPVAGDVGLANDDDTCAAAASANNFNSNVPLTVTAGDTFYVQVGGWNGQTGTSELNIEAVETVCDDGLDGDGDGDIDCFDSDCIGSVACIVDPPTNVVCTDNGVDTVTATWDVTATGPGATDQNIYQDGVLILANEPLTTTSFPAIYVPGFQGVVEVCIETNFAAGTSVQACCAVGVGAPANDDCANAIPAVLGANPYTNLATVLDGPIDCDGNMTTDVWFTYTAATSGGLTIDTCDTGTLLDTTLIVYDGSAGCPLPGDLGLACDDDTCAPPAGGDAFLSSVTIPVTAGDELLIQVGGWNGTTGTGNLTITEACGTLGAATCTADINAGTVTVAWTDNANATTGYEIFENGVSVGTAPAGSSSFVVAAPTIGTNTYEVTWTCVLTAAPGDVATCDATVIQQIPAGTTDLIIQNEGIPDAGNPTGSLGDIDSGAALEAALLAAGQTVYRTTIANFDASGLDFNSVDTIWLCLGSFPNDYRLTAAEGDLLGTLNAGGTGVYLENGDHWGFQHVVSLLDARDGHDDTVAVDGDDTFTAMDAQAGGVADLASIWATPQPYSQDASAAGANDWTDQLAVATLDAEVTLVEVLWANSDDTATGELLYPTALYTEHTTGENMIVKSWEFGGFPVAEQNALAAEYLELLGRAPTGQGFIRTDCNSDGTTNIADAVFKLGILFPGMSGPNVPQCELSCDSNDDNVLNIADAIFTLGVLFPGAGGPPTVAEPTTCGGDPTPGGVLTCNMFDPC